MNPLDFSAGFPPKLSITGEDSLGERVQRALPDAKVVKAFNTIGNTAFVDPSFSEGKPTMLIAGNDEDAKRTVGDVLADFGWPRAGGHRWYRRLSTRSLGPRLHAAHRPNPQHVSDPNSDRPGSPPSTRPHGPSLGRMAVTVVTGTGSAHRN